MLETIEIPSGFTLSQVPCKGKYRLGLCDYKTKQISFHEKLSQEKFPKLYEFVLLHEIAHIQAGRGAGHGFQWWISFSILCQENYVGGKKLRYETKRFLRLIK